MLKRTELTQHSQNLGQVVHRLAARQELPGRVAVTGRRIGDVDPEQLASAAQLADQAATVRSMRAKPLTDLCCSEPLLSKCLARVSRISEDPLSGRKGVEVYSAASHYGDHTGHESSKSEDCGRSVGKTSQASRIGHARGSVFLAGGCGRHRGQGGVAENGERHAPHLEFKPGRQLAQLARCS